MDSKTFSERHPRLNLLLGAFLFFLLVIAGFLCLRWALSVLGAGLSEFINWIIITVPKLDAVIIVALITGTISIVGVIFTSVISKFVEYKKNRQAYLAKKREKPYAAFVDVIYKLQDNTKVPNSYSEEQLYKDISSFSKEITLWGSHKVVKLWNKFREKSINSITQKAKTDNLFILEEIMNEMRKDLGLKKVKKGDLLSFFVNDVKSSFRGGK